MKKKLFVFQTVNLMFVSFKLVGDKELHASEVEEYYNANKFEEHEEAEANAFLEKLNTGSTSNPRIKEDWTLTIDPSLLPVNKRIFFAELIDEPGMIDNLSLNIEKIDVYNKRNAEMAKEEAAFENVIIEKPLREPGYLYGYLFRSGKDGGGVILDLGKEEYSTNSAEIWMGQWGFVQMDNLSSMPYGEICGKWSRVKSKEH